MQVHHLITGIACICLPFFPFELQCQSSNLSAVIGIKHFIYPRLIEHDLVQSDDKTVEQLQFYEGIEFDNYIHKKLNLNIQINHFTKKIDAPDESEGFKKYLVKDKLKLFNFDLGGRLDFKLSNMLSLAGGSAISLISTTDPEDKEIDFSTLGIYKFSITTGLKITIGKIKLLLQFTKPIKTWDISLFDNLENNKIVVDHLGIKELSLSMSYFIAGGNDH